MNYKYIVICDKENLAKDKYSTYGIAAEKDGVILERVGDVCSDLDEIAILVEKCNRNKLSPSHLRDVIEDFILSR